MDMLPDISSLINKEAVGKIPDLFKVNASDTPERKNTKRALQFLILLVGLGAISGIISFIFGHHSHGTYSELPWGILIATYVFFVISGSGLCMISSLGHVFGIKKFEPIAKKAIFFDLVLLLIGFAVIGVELERPFLLMLMAVISPNLSAPIWWMGALYGGYMVILLFELYFLIREDHEKSKITGIISVAAAVAATSTVGSVFGMNHARPFWHGTITPIYFIVTALLSGAAILIIIVYFTDYYENNGNVRSGNLDVLRTLGKLLALFIGITLIMNAWKFLTALYGSYYGSVEAVDALLFGRLAISFWSVEVILGAIIPLWLLMGRRNENIRNIAIASILPMIAMFITRYNFVFAGQMFSLKPVLGQAGERLSYLPLFKGSITGYLNYTPSIVEILIVLGALSAAVLGYVAGSKILKVEYNPSAAEH